MSSHRQLKRRHSLKNTAKAVDELARGNMEQTVAISKSIRGLRNDLEQIVRVNILMFQFLENKGLVSFEEFQRYLEEQERRVKEHGNVSEESSGSGDGDSGSSEAGDPTGSSEGHAEGSGEVATEAGE